MLAKPHAAQQTNPLRRGTENGLAIALAARRDKAQRRAADLAPIFAEIRAGGATSLQQIADALNVRGIPAARGGSWSKTQVARVLGRVRE